MTANSNHFKNHMPKHMVIVHRIRTLSTIVGPGVTYQQILVDDQPTRNAVDTIYTKTTQIPHVTVKHDETLNSDGRNNIQIDDKYEKYRQAFYHVPRPYGAI